MIKLHLPLANVVFVFDNAKSHEVYAADSLNTNNLNLQYGLVKNKDWVGKAMRDGWYCDKLTNEIITQKIEEVIDGKWFRKGIKDIYM